MAKHDSKETKELAFPEWNEKLIASQCKTYWDSFNMKPEWIHMPVDNFQLLLQIILKRGKKVSGGLQDFRYKLDMERGITWWNDWADGIWLEFEKPYKPLKVPVHIYGDPFIRVSNNG